LKNELKEAAQAWFGNMTKAVVDIDQKIIAIGGEMHADAEELLLKNGSKQENLWGINLYPYEKGENFIQYTALINIRPRQGNRDMEIQNKKIKDAILKVVNEVIK